MAEDVGDVGGKALIQVAFLECNLVHLQVLFIITQSIAIASGHPAVVMQTGSYDAFALCLQTAEVNVKLAQIRRTGRGKITRVPTRDHHVNAV